MTSLMTSPMTSGRHRIERAHDDALSPHRCASLGSPLPTGAPAPPAAVAVGAGRAQYGARPGSPHRDSSSLQREAAAHGTGHGATAAAQQQIQYA